ncbi:TPA: ATP-binding protein [Acinetobacter baumannii]|uniref:ATP-binding protein n=1 Tax=Acinetobacter baumannii TaxID=470 RepID=UPI00338D8817
MEATEPKKHKNFVKFELHPSILSKIIREQAGTLDKALAELVMNSVDAGATRVDIQYEYEPLVGIKSITVIDDGSGFHNEDQLNFFTVFGQPHSENDSFYGKYRIGRGQVLNFGKVTWRSHNYKMVVDLGDSDKELELESIGYNLDYFDEKQPGCIVRIDLYNPKSFSFLYYEDEITTERLEKSVFGNFVQQVLFVPIPVCINNIQRNVNFAEIEWSYEDDHAYYLIQSPSLVKFKDIDQETYSLKIYNRGVFVADMNHKDVDCCGYVVSKNQLQINMARNAIMIGSPYWEDIFREIKRISYDIFHKERSNPATDYERSIIIKKISSDPLFTVRHTFTQIKHFLELPLFKLQSGKLISTIDIVKKYNRITICPDMSGKERTTVSEFLEKENILVIDRNCIGGEHIYGWTWCTSEDTFTHEATSLIDSYLNNILGFTAYGNPEKVLALLKHEDSKYVEKLNINENAIEAMGEKVSNWVLGKARVSEINISILSYDDLATNLDISYKDVKEKELSIEQKFVLAQIRKMNLRFKKFGLEERKIVVGASDNALAWTDSSKKIWVNVKLLDYFRLNKFVDLVQILIHEYSHNNGTTNTHQSHRHDGEFYKQFHDNCMKINMHELIDNMQVNYVRWLADTQTRPSGKVGYMLDRLCENYPKLLRKETDGTRLRTSVFNNSNDK